MSKARDLADFVSAGSPLADGTISVSEVSGAAPTADPSFTGNVTMGGSADIAGSLNSGTDAGSGDARIELGVSRTADGNAYLDLHAESGADYSGRLLRTSGTNGALSLSNKGSGTTSVGVEGAGIVITKTNDIERTRITSDGKFGVNTTAPAAMIESVGTAGINPLQLSAPKEIFTRIRRTDAGADTNYIGNFIFTAKNDASVEKEYAKFLVQQSNVEAGNEDGNVVIQAAKDGSLFSAFVIDGNGDLISLRTSSGEKFRIASSGQLGIGGANYGTAGQVLTSGGSGAAPSWQSVSFTTNVVTSNTTASANNHYYLNAATVTLTLPASPSVGDEVRISEVAGNTDCVIGRNGSNIMGDASDLTIDTAYLVLSLRYVDATIGWAFS